MTDEEIEFEAARQRSEALMLDSLGEDVDHVGGLKEHTACGLSGVQFGFLARRRGHTIGRKRFPTCAYCAEYVIETFDPVAAERCEKLGVPLEAGLTHMLSGSTRRVWCGLSLNELQVLKRLDHRVIDEVSFGLHLCPACVEKCSLSAVKTRLADLEKA